MFTRDAVEIPCPDSAAGLYIRTRTDQIVKVSFLFLNSSNARQQQKKKKKLITLHCFEFSFVHVASILGVVPVILFQLYTYQNFISIICANIPRYDLSLMGLTCWKDLSLQNILGFGNAAKTKHNKTKR